MRGLLKYIILFIILILIGIVSINFYNNSKLDNDFKKTNEKTDNNKKEDKKEEVKEEKKEDNSTKIEEKKEETNNNTSQDTNSNNANSNVNNDTNSNTNSNTNNGTNNNNTSSNNKTETPKNETPKETAPTNNEPKKETPIEDKKEEKKTETEEKKEETKRKSTPAVDNDDEDSYIITIDDNSDDKEEETIEDNVEDEIKEDETVEAESIKFNKSTLVITKGKTKKFSYTISPSNTTDKTVKYVYNKKYIKVYKSGKIKGLKVGATTLKIKTSNGKYDKLRIIIKSKESKVVEAESIKFDKSVLKMTEGEMKEFNYTISPSNTTNQTVKYSFDKDYITVYTAGMVKAKKAGTTYLKIMTSNGKTDTMKIVIKKKENKTVEAESIEFDQESMSLTLGETKKFSYTITPSNTTDKTVKYAFDKDYITVYTSGKVKAKKVGTTYLKIMTSNGKTDTMKIVIKEKENKVIEAESIKFNKESMSLILGETKKFSYTITPSNTTDKNVKYSFDKDYITVYTSGKIKAKKVGITYLTIMTLNGKTDKMKITIKEEEKKEATKVKDGSLIGSTAYAATRNHKIYLYKTASTSSSKLTVLKAGIPFRVLAANSADTWWKVNYNGTVGYVQTKYCLINLPDYIPSITYSIANAESSIAKSSGVKLSIYGKKLYKTGKVYNERLDRNEYIVPIVYSTAKKINKAQQKALREGYSLKILDGYRPKSVADLSRNSLAALYKKNSKVRNGINYSYNNGRRVTWGQNWFIAQNLSSHSVASAIDVTLTKKGSTASLVGPTAYDELSTKAIKYKTPVSGQRSVRSSLYAKSMNKMAKDLDRIMVTSGMTNLASEWWHFQDNTARSRIRGIESSGLNFQPTRIVSTK